MFKVDLIRFNHADEFQEYKFSEHSFVYGKNTRGKTALTMAIDYILGSSDKLTYQGFDCIASKVETINQVISFMFTVRYLEKLICENKLEEYENCIMDNIGFIPCISEVYK